MITILMITMNEAGAVERVIRDIRSAVPEAEILIVDSSKDDTPKIAGSLGARVVRQFPPQGYGKAMDLGFRSAAGDVIVTLDCDNTYPAAQIPMVLAFMNERGADMVDCSRLRCKPAAMPWFNYFANRFFAIVASLLFFRLFTDLHSGMRAYKKSMLENISYQPAGAALPVELLLKPVKMGYKVENYFIDYYPRIGESTMQPLQSAWMTLKRILRVRFGGK